VNSAVSLAEPEFTDHDKRWMRAAIAQSNRAEGRTGSNPPVGCVILDKNGQLCAVGHTGAGGVPHAETDALAKAGQAASGGTAYVTLEPCAHHGKTPPCIDALIAAQISRLVVAVGDPDKRVDGRGLAKAKASGIEVITGVESATAMAVLRGFLCRITTGRPFVCLKMAASLDGGIALADGEKRWLTGAPMRRFVHEVRSRCDALLTGVGTVLADDPELTCRVPGMTADNPAIFVVDSHLRTPPSARLFSRQDRAVTLFCTEAAPRAHHDVLLSAGAKIEILPASGSGQVDLGLALDYLGAAGVNILLVEAGTGVATAVLADGLADQILWTQSPHILGADARPAIGALKLVALPLENHYTQTDASMIGQDQLRVFAKNNAAHHKG